MAAADDDDDDDDAPAEEVKDTHQRGQKRANGCEAKESVKRLRKAVGVPTVEILEPPSATRRFTCIGSLTASTATCFSWHTQIRWTNCA